MREVFLTVLVTLLLTVGALRLEERKPGENGWYIPQADGTNKWLDMDEAEKLLANGELMESRLINNDVSFYLYTKFNPTEGEKIEAMASSILDSHFHKNNPTRFVIHGWKQGYEDSMNTEITKAWLSRGDYNIIIVDWTRARSVDYVSAVLAVPGAGAKVGDMIIYLHENFDMPLDNLYVIGHSLGAQVSGFAGKTVGKGRIHTIIGLDPAFPMFSFDKPHKRLSFNDAYYVESIQTNGGMLGSLKPIGRGTFYPNGGKRQPGCGLDPTGLCSHRRSVTYYSEAVTQNNFGTIKCEDYQEALANDCGSTYSGVLMGADTNANMVGGHFYVPVNSKAPFGTIN